MILPLVVLRRLDQALADTKQAALNRDRQLADQGIENREPVLRAASGRSFYNTSPLTFDRLVDDEDNVPTNLRSYIEAFSPSARDVIDKFRFDTQIDKLAGAGLAGPGFGAVHRSRPPSGPRVQHGHGVLVRGACSATSTAAPASATNAQSLTSTARCDGVLPAQRIAA